MIVHEDKSSIFDRLLWLTYILITYNLMEKCNWSKSTQQIPQF